MKKLLEYLKNLSVEERDSFVLAIGTTIGYLRKAASVGQKPGPELCVLIERHSNHDITRKDLRPTDYFDIWPEIDDRKQHRRRSDAVLAEREDAL